MSRAQELCESRGGRPGLPLSLISPMVYVDVCRTMKEGSACGDDVSFSCRME